MKISKKSEVRSRIPTASLPDIIFLLIIFFMATTVLKKFTGLQVNLPAAERIEKLESQRHISYIWISQDGSISLDDKLISKDDLSPISTIMYEKRVADPQLIVSLKVDRAAEMYLVSQIQEQLRKADALRVNYNTLRKTN